MLTARLNAERNGYGFGHDWSLVISNRTRKQSKTFWLGQDVKFIRRCLCIDEGYLIRECEKATGSREFDRPSTQRFLVDAFLVRLIPRDGDTTEEGREEAWREFEGAGYKLEPKTRQALLRAAITREAWAFACQ